MKSEIENVIAALKELGPQALLGTRNALQGVPIAGRWRVTGDRHPQATRCALCGPWASQSISLRGHLDYDAGEPSEAYFLLRVGTTFWKKIPFPWEDFFGEAYRDALQMAMEEVDRLLLEKGWILMNTEVSA